MMHLPDLMGFGPALLLRTLLARTLLPHSLFLRTLLFLAGLAVGRTAAAAVAHDPAAGILAGIVVDSATGAPLPAAQVRVVGIGRAEATHDDGSFRFTSVPAGVQTLMVQRLGYAAAVRQVLVRDGETTTIRIALVASAAQLSSVVVTGTVGERLREEMLSPTSVLSGAALDRQTSTTVARTIENEPGVSVTSVGPATARPVIRGLSGDRILLLEDGMRPGDLSAMSGDHAVAIEPLTAQQVEVVRGPMSLLYGPNALGGVVNVVREEVPKTAPEHPHGMLSLEGNSVNGGTSGGGWGTAGLGVFAVRGEASLRHAGDLRTPTGRLGNTGLRTTSLAAGGALTGDWGHAGMAYRFYDSRYGIPGGFVGAHEEGVDVEMRRHMLRADVERESGIGPFSVLHATGSLSRYDHEEIEDEGALGTRFGQDMAVLDAVGRHDAIGVLTQGAVGIRTQARNVLTGGSLRTPNTRDYSVAGFVVEEAAAGPLRLQAGLRYDWSRYVPQEDASVRVGDELIPARPRTFGSFSGSMGVLWEARPWLRVGASLARAYRTPDFNELYSDGPHLAAFSFDVGDPRLRRETGIGGDLFVRLNSGRVRAEASAFRNRMDDFIYLRNTGVPSRQSDRNVFQYTNTDARLSGVEGILELSLSSRWVFDGTVSYVEGRITGPVGTLPADPALGLPERAGSRWLPFMPPLNGRAGLRYESPRWFAGSGVRMAGRQDRLGDFETETTGYAVVDANAGVRMLLGGRLHTLTLRVNNAFDREYRDHLARTKAIMPEAGRDLSLLYRLMF